MGFQYLHYTHKNPPGKWRGERRGRVEGGGVVNTFKCKGMRYACIWKEKWWLLGALKLKMKVWEKGLKDPPKLDFGDYISFKDMAKPCLNIKTWC